MRSKENTINNRVIAFRAEDSPLHGVRSGLSALSRAVLLNLPNVVIFNTVPHVVETPTITLFLLLFHNCDFATVMNHNVSI